MRTRMAARLAVFTALACTSSLQAHHSGYMYETTPVWVKGTVVRFDPVAPHARIYLDQTSEGGQTQRWMVDGPAPNQLARMGIDQDFLKAGDVLEVCGYPLKAEVASQRAIPQSSSTPKGRGTGCARSG
mgnify:CR=1 FL=1